MAGKRIKAYTLEQAQRLVADAWRLGEERRRRNRLWNGLYRTGRVVDELLAADNFTPGQLEKMIGLNLDTINLTLPHLNITIASSVARDPRFVATPWGTNPADEAGADAARVLIHHFWNKADATESVRRAQKDSRITGNGFTKTVWARDEMDVARDDEAIAEELAELIAADQDIRSVEGGDPADMEFLRSLVATTEARVLVDQAVVEYVNPDHILVDADADRLEKARWVAQRVVLPLDEVLANPAWENADEIVANLRMANGDGTSLRDGVTTTPGLFDHTGDVADVYQYVELFEFYDQRTRTLKIFPLGQDVCLYDGPFPWVHGQSPFTHFRAYDDGDNFWSFGDVENMAALQSHLNEAFTQQMDNLDRAGNIYIGDRTAMDDDTAQQLQNAGPDALVLVDLPNGKAMADLVTAFPRQPLPNDVYGAQQTIRDAMAAVIGINEFQQGGTGSDRMAATTAAVVDGMASLRAQDPIMAVERACAKIAHLILCLVQEFLDENTAVRVAGDSGVAWVHVSPEDIIGDYRVTVEGGSTSAVNPATRAQQGQNLFGMAQALPQFGLDPMPMLRKAIRNLGENPDLLLKQLPPQPAPQMGPQMDPSAAGPAPAGPPMDPSAMSATDQSLGLGGPPVPAQDEGGIAL